MKEWCNLPADHLSFMNYVENVTRRLNVLAIPLSG